MSHGGRGVFLQLKMIRWEYPIKKANDDEGSFCRRDMPLPFNQAHTLKGDASQARLFVNLSTLAWYFGMFFEPEHDP